jgi:DNA-binding MarR family transcriptional regulator
MHAASIHQYLERLSNLLRADARRCGAEYGLQPVQMDALHYLAICNRYSDTPLAVAEYLGLTKGTVSQTLNVLVAKGLIVKSGDQRDKRVVHLVVTAAGQQLLDRSVPSPSLRAGCENLSETDHARVLKNLQMLLLICQKANGSRVFGPCHSCRHNQVRTDGGQRCGLTQEPLSTEDTQRICREFAA